MGLVFTASNGRAGVYTIRASNTEGAVSGSALITIAGMYKIYNTTCNKRLVKQKP